MSWEKSCTFKNKLLTEKSRTNGIKTKMKGKKTMERIKALREKTGVGLMECKKTLEAFNNDLDKSIEYLNRKGISRAAKKSGRVASDGIVHGHVSEDGKIGALIEVNCETDFVAKNSNFKQFVGSILTLIIENNPLNEEELLSLLMKDGRTVKEHLTTLITTFGENILIRRFERFQAKEEGVVSFYIHNDYLTEGKVGVMLQTSVKYPETLLNPKFNDFVKNMLMHITALKPKFLDRGQVPNQFLVGQYEQFLSDPENEGKPVELIERIANNRLEKFIKDSCLLHQNYLKETNKTIEQLIADVNSALGQEEIRIEKFSCFVKGEIE